MIYDISSFLPYKPLRAYMEELPQEAIEYFRKTAFRRVYGQSDCLMFPGERFPYFGLVLEGIVCGFTQDGFQRQIHWVASCGEGFVGLIPKRSASEQIHIGFFTTTQLVLISPSHLRAAANRFEACAKLFDSLSQNHTFKKMQLAQIQSLPDPEERLNNLKSLYPQLDLILSPYQREELAQLPFDRPTDFRPNELKKRTNLFTATKRKPPYLNPNPL
jgi:hypothetical protein